MPVAPPRPPRRPKAEILPPEFEEDEWPRTPPKQSSKFVRHFRWIRSSSISVQIIMYAIWLNVFVWLIVVGFLGSMFVEGLISDAPPN